MEDVVISIKPKFVSKIISFEKKYEFRKNIFKKEINNVYIYSSSPIQKVIGFFNFKSVDIDSPTNLWKKYEKVAGIDEKLFFDYFNNKLIGYAILIENLFIYDQPKDPNELFINFSPPQNFSYIKLRN